MSLAQFPRYFPGDRLQDGGITYHIVNDAVFKECTGNEVTWGMVGTYVELGLHKLSWWQIEVNEDELKLP